VGRLSCLSAHCNQIGCSCWFVHYAVRAYLRRLIRLAGIDKKVKPYKLRHTAELVDIQVLLGHVNLATTQIYRT
jgi:site-specific recombinase XerD